MSWGGVPVQRGADPRGTSTKNVSSLGAHKLGIRGERGTFAIGGGESKHVKGRSGEVDDTGAF